MLTNLIGGVVVENFGWEIMFYAPAAVTLLWCVIWWLRVFESPEKHPSISDAELEYIVATRYCKMSCWRVVFVKTVGRQIEFVGT